MPIARWCSSRSRPAAVTASVDCRGGHPGEGAPAAAARRLWLAAQDTGWAGVRIDVIGVRVGRRRTPEVAPEGWADGAGPGVLGGGARPRRRNRRDRGPITSGLPGFHLVGLPDTALQESRDRVRAAITNCANSWPMSRLTVALSPATLPKMGSVYDIALACAVLSASRNKTWYRLEETVLLGNWPRRSGEAGPRGAASGAGRQTAGLAGGGGAGRQSGRGQPDRRDRCSGVATLRQLQRWLAGNGQLEDRVEAPQPHGAIRSDLSDDRPESGPIRRGGRRGGGAHHLMMTGRREWVKPCLRNDFQDCYPPLTESEALEVTAIHSVAGLLSNTTPLITRPPFIAPHHSSSVAALVGGGSGMARPGAVSRAHRGVLFLDECAEIGTGARRRCELRWRTATSGSPAETVSLLPRPLPTRAGSQSVPVRTGRSEGLHLLVTATATVSGQAVRPVARPRRPAGSDAHRAGRCVRRRIGGEHRRCPSPRRARTCDRRRALVTAWIHHQRGGDGGLLRQALSAPALSDGVAEGRPGTRPGRIRASTARRGSRGRWPTWRGAPRRIRTTSRSRWFRAPGGRRMTDHGRCGRGPTPVRCGRTAVPGVGGAGCRRLLRSRPRSGCVAARCQPALAERTAARFNPTRLQQTRDAGSARAATVTPDDDEAAAGVRVLAGADLRAKPTGIAPLALWVIGLQRLDEILITGPPRDRRHQGGHRLRAAARRR